MIKSNQTNKQYSSYPVWIIRLVIVLLMLATLLDRASANNGPHGGFTATTDACAGCHRAHTAAAGRLLIDSIPNLCYSCHGNAGTGADTNVVDGIYLERDGTVEAPPEGAPSRGLKAGGFINALMDTNRDGTAASSGVTSNHLVDGSNGTAWGNGTLGSGAGIPIPLSCVSCHDPHGGGTYRSLRPMPIGSGSGAGVAVADEVIKTYTVISSTNNYMVENYGALASPLALWCSQCHTRYSAVTGSGHTNSGDPIFTYRHATDSVSCVRCHVAHGSPASMGTFSGTVRWPDGSAAPNGNNRSSLLRLDNRGVCAYCHVKPDGSVAGGACNACHGAPPATGAHVAHAGTSSLLLGEAASGGPEAPVAGANVGYGTTGSFATSTSYQFGCGECHPSDASMHQNGIVEVELSSVGAPVGSLKSQNSATADYAGGICGGVYCHSGVAVTSGPVGNPLVNGSGQYLLDPHGNLTYDPYTVTETRVYKSSPAWSGGTISGNCTDCHSFPLTTSVPALQAGVGASHQWIDDFGYGNLHAYNMSPSYGALACRTCHYGEIIEAGTWTRDPLDVTTYNSVSIASKVSHTNGQRDVTFDPVNPVVYGTHTYSLAAATYNPAEKSCGNVGCHKLQTYVQWGTPYRWWTNECDLCHRYGSIPPPAGNAPVNTPAHDGLDILGQPCVSCHTQIHGNGK